MCYPVHGESCVRYHIPCVAGIGAQIKQTTGKEHLHLRIGLHTVTQAVDVGAHKGRVKGLRIIGKLRVDVDVPRVVQPVFRKAKLRQEESVHDPDGDIR